MVEYTPWLPAVIAVSTSPALSDTTCPYPISAFVEASSRGALPVLQLP
jgi:hypothetical protein